MEFVATTLPDVLLVKPSVLVDSRSSFMEVHEARKFAAARIPHVFVHDNQSQSQRATLRGLHHQIRRPQGKLVRVLTGEIFDVAVDLRRHLPSFGQWVSAALSA
jgi:dTDP-4-dehydrorhamnose 3,5-epimerase